MARFAGDVGGWRYATSRLARHRLLDTTASTSAGVVAGQLTLLRLAGDHRSLRIATRRVLNEGPALAVTRSIANVSLDRSTRTTTQADLILLTDSGDAADEFDAIRHLEWLFAAIADADGPFSRTTSPVRVDAALAAIRGLVRATSAATRRHVIDAVLDLPPLTDPLLAREWNKVASAVLASDWTIQDARLAASTAARTTMNSATNYSALLVDTCPRSKRLCSRRP